MRAVGYVRVSGRNQVEGHGFERQEEAIRGFCQVAGVEVVRVYREEGVSGTLGEADRPAFAAMVSDMIREGIEAVVVEGLDRLARELRIQEQLLVYLASKGLSLHSARTGEDVTAAIAEDPMRRAMVQIQGVFAELEKGLLVRKLRQAREARREETGKCEGRRGYAELAPELIEKVKRMRRSYGSRRGMTYREVAEHLNAEGYRTLSGGLWTGHSVQMLMRRASRRVLKEG